MIRAPESEAWGYVAGEVNRLAAEIEEIKAMILQFHKPKRTKEELAEVRRENLRKAREARAKK